MFQKLIRSDTSYYVNDTCFQGILPLSTYWGRYPRTRIIMEIYKKRSLNVARAIAMAQLSGAIDIAPFEQTYSDMQHLFPSLEFQKNYANLINHYLVKGRNQ